MNVLDAVVRWNLAFVNPPALYVMLAAAPEFERYYRFDLDHGRMFIARAAPAVTFIYEADRGGGALGRTLTLVDGSEYRTKGGWSSNAAVVNRLRRDRSDVHALLPGSIVEVTYVLRGPRGWKGLGYAGLCLDLRFAGGVIKRLLPGVHLAPYPIPGDLEVGSEQAFIIGGGVESDLWVPSAEPSRAVKAAGGSELYQRTEHRLREEVGV